MSMNISSGPVMHVKESTDVPVLLQNAATYLREAGISSPRYEAEMLLCALLPRRRLDLYIHPHVPVPQHQADRFWRWLYRRARREPLQYITGEVEFSGLLLTITPGVFIPRPETELIVEEASRLTPSPRRILDLCTGSGALAIALAQRFPLAEITATDWSEVALSNAKKNIERHRCEDQVSLKQGDLFGAIQGMRTRGDEDDPPRFDLIVCNPPYISQTEWPTLQPEVRDYEPYSALVSAEQGTTFYRRVIDESVEYLSINGRLIFELGAGQSAWFASYLGEDTPLMPTFVPDLNGIDRVAVCALRQTASSERLHG